LTLFKLVRVNCTVHVSWCTLSTVATDSSVTEKPFSTLDLKDIEIKLDNVIDLDNTLVLDKYIKDKRYFLLNQWMTDYPSSKVTNYAELSTIITKSKAAQLWVNKVSADYIKFNEMPKWVLNDLDVRQLWKSNYKELSMKLKLEVKAATDEKQKLTDELYRKVSAINQRIEKKYLEVAKENALVLIDKISVDALPIEQYEETLSMSAEKAKLKINEIHQAYQADLAKRYVKGILSLDDLLTILKGQSSTV